MVKFEKISIKQVQVLSELFAESSLMQTEFIKTKYLKSAFNFEDTLEFLEELNWLEIKGDQLLVKPKYEELLKRLSSSKKKIEIICSLLVNSLLYGKSILTEQTMQFLNNFKYVGSQWVFEPTASQRLIDSGLRNFLIDAGFLNLDPKELKYIITDIYCNDYAKIIRRDKLSAAEFAGIQQRIAEIGRGAELSILEYERIRLESLPDLVRMIEHVADQNIAAGYDIKSFEIVRQENAIPRFIEVKAVSLQDYKFYWTSNEIDASRLLGRSYYLYLLPVIGSHNFDIDNLKIIQDPYVNIYKNNNEWAQSSEVLSFYKLDSNF